ncbi:hypothetical protein NQ317_001556 [Molorchus minor]|uniref:Uncharacterized protein n=1 Tax=Molorchus minor TaxID=1323400 RepID=A0ABQ9J2E6_9CUCU|nr:hypothetical protein NQ317_001556 [Molorchus minor]
MYFLYFYKNIIGKLIIAIVLQISLAVTKSNPKTPIKTELIVKMIFKRIWNDDPGLMRISFRKCHISVFVDNARNS